MDSHALISACSSPPSAGQALVTSEATMPPRSDQADDSFISQDSTLSVEQEDHERHSKGKRKRTAAKDRAILEASYSANPKPDKPARLEIVKRVSLNEKEVQIWFQNRRQNDRRKSRPLSPQEVAALRSGGMQILSSESMVFGHIFDLEMPCPLLSDHAAASSSDEAERITVPSPLDRLVSLPEATTCGREPLSSNNRSGLPRALSGPSEYRANTCDPGITLAPRDSMATASLPPPTSSVATYTIFPRPDSSQGSQFRLSLSLDGKAEVVSVLTSPPHPSRPSPDFLASLGPIRQPNLLHRGGSSNVTLPPISALTSSLASGHVGALPPRLTRGRSRDVSAWEFICDDENREDALTVQARHESSGSATAAISLLRSTSSTSNGLGPRQPSNSRRRDAAVTKAPSRNAMAQRPRLGRVSSSVTHMASVLDNQQRAVGWESKHGRVRAPGLVSGNDSDKENWSPDEDDPYGSRQHHAPSQVGAARRPLLSTPRQTANLRRSSCRGLQDRARRRSPSSRASTAPALARPYCGRNRGHSPLLDIYEDADSIAQPSSAAALAHVADDDVERFMRGQVSPSKKGDVDAVAGLLSLSQGNWR